MRGSIIGRSVLWVLGGRPGAGQLGKGVIVAFFEPYILLRQDVAAVAAQFLHTYSTPAARAASAGQQFAAGKGHGKKLCGIYLALTSALAGDME